MALSVDINHLLTLMLNILAAVPFSIIAATTEFELDASQATNWIKFELELSIHYVHISDSNQQYRLSATWWGNNHAWAKFGMQIGSGANQMPRGGK